MEKLTARQELVLEVIDQQIAELEKKLAKAQPLFNELNKLKATRRVLMDTKSTTGGGAARSSTRITQEQVIHAMRQYGRPVTAEEIAKDLGCEQHIVRAHFNRHKDTTYVTPSRGMWELVDNAGGDEGDDDDDD